MDQAVLLVEGGNYTSTLFILPRKELNVFQVGSNDYAEANAPDEKVARDLRWLAEVGALESPPVKIAYEPWAFSKRVSTFEHAWRLVKMGVGIIDAAVACELISESRQPRAVPRHRIAGSCSRLRLQCT